MLSLSSLSIISKLNSYFVLCHCLFSYGLFNKPIGLLLTLHSNHAICTLQKIIGSIIVLSQVETNNPWLMFELSL